MNKEFIPYEQALALKELGFDEPCFGYYNGQGNYIGEEGKMNSNCNKLGMHGTYCTAPTFSQAFRWFREKHSLRSFVDTRVYDVDSPNQWIYDFQIKMGNGVDTQPFYSGDFDTYEEAEFACLVKLIEIVKKNTNE